MLLDGSADLYICDEQDEIHTYEMEKNKVYNVHKNVWHHIVVGEDTTVLVVENRNTSKDNTEKTGKLLTIRDLTEVMILNMNGFWKNNHAKGQGNS